MRPCIGVTSETDVGFVASRKQLRASNAVPVAYLEAIAEAGGLPVVIPVAVAEGCAAAYLDLLEGLLLTGGEDVDAGYYGEEPEKQMGAIDVARDRMEWELTRLALQRDLPILGICRGIQMINVAAGGSLYQDIAHRPEYFVKHRQEAPGDFPTHKVRVAADSRLATIIGESELRTNTFHHQAVKTLAPGFRAVAWAADGVVEAIEAEQQRFAVGVQYHPELMWRSHPPSRRLFEALVEAAEEHGRG